MNLPEPYEGSRKTERMDFFFTKVSQKLAMKKKMGNETMLVTTKVKTPL